MTTTLDADRTVDTFAAAVRTELFDLDAEVIDELTDGLEADLADKLADGEPLGDPTAYAAELRAAAGLDVRRRSSVAESLRVGLAELRPRLTALASNPVIAPGFRFLVSLRPIWWLARGVVLFGVLNVQRQWFAIPNDPAQLLLLVVLLVASVQWGRGRWLPWSWSRSALYIASAIAVVMAPVVAGYTGNLLQQYWNPEPGISANGLLLDGTQVTNIFAYGPDGKPLRDVQLFDQNGHPLAVVSWGSTSQWDETLGNDVLLVPSTAVAGREGWNVYPLQSVPSDSIDDNTGEVGSWAKRSDVVPPLASVQPLVGYAGPDPSPTPAP